MNRYPNKIIQQEPQEGVGLYFQDNFLQRPLSFNANINEPRSQLITTPFRQYPIEEISHEKEDREKIKFSYMESDRIDMTNYNKYHIKNDNPDIVS